MLYICGHVKAPQLSSEATLISVDDSFGLTIEGYVN